MTKLVGNVLSGRRQEDSVVGSNLDLSSLSELEGRKWWQDTSSSVERLDFRFPVGIIVGAIDQSWVDRGVWILWDVS
jgi:hypothetical protein